jgi:hypothetical protein
LEPIKINYKNNEKEYGRVMCKYYSKSISTKFDILISILLILSGISSWSYYGYSSLWLVMLLAGLVFLILMILANFIMPAVQFKMQSKFKDEYFLEFNEEDINFKTEQLNSKLGWAYYNEVRESAEVFYLFYGKSMFTFIPKRAFLNIEQESQFRELIKRKINSPIINV